MFDSYVRTATDGTKDSRINPHQVNSSLCHVCKHHVLQQKRLTEERFSTFGATEEWHRRRCSWWQSRSKPSRRWCRRHGKNCISHSCQTVVFDHLNLLDETLATVRTLEWPFTRVHPHMMPEVRHNVSRVGALPALELLGCVSCARREDLPTQWWSPSIAVAGSQQRYGEAQCHIALGRWCWFPRAKNRT